jgi:hypothetical protein
VPTLINEFGKSVKVSAALALSDSWSKGSCITCLALLTAPLATLTLLLDGLSIGSPAATRAPLVT